MTAGLARGGDASPPFRAWLPLDRSLLPGDIVAGITLAVIGAVLNYARRWAPIMDGSAPGSG
jgi:hypothetical protein